MPKRFSTLKRALKLLRPVGAAEGTPTPDAPAGTALRNFQEYRKEAVTLNYTRATGSRPGSSIVIGVQPFGDLENSTDIYSTTISTRSNTNLPNVGLSFAITGIEQSASSHKTAAGFSPAKAIVRRVTGTSYTDSAAPSQITGLRYKTIAANSITVPFGRVTGRTREKAQKSHIISIVEQTNEKFGVNFKPEKF